MTSRTFANYPAESGSLVDRSAFATPLILANKAVPASVTGTVAETALATITIPGGLMGPNGSIRVTPIFSITNNANNKSLGIKLGGQSIFAIGLTTNSAYQAIATARNRGSQSAQLSTSGGGYAAVFTANTNVDTSVDQVLTINGTLANAADTITLEGYTVEVLPGV